MQMRLSESERAGGEISRRVELSHLQLPLQRDSRPSSAVAKQEDLVFEETINDPKASNNVDHRPAIIVVMNMIMIKISLRLLLQQ